jgi:hypothetical protein
MNVLVLPLLLLLSSSTDSDRWQTISIQQTNGQIAYHQYAAATVADTNKDGSFTFVSRTVFANPFGSHFDSSKKIKAYYYMVRASCSTNLVMITGDSLVDEEGISIRNNILLDKFKNGPLKPDSESGLQQILNFICTVKDEDDVNDKPKTEQSSPPVSRFRVNYSYPA